jgi:hypothetical protein
MAFDPSQLTPLTSMQAATNPFGGDQGGLTAGTGGMNGQSHQTFVDPQGRKVMAIQLPGQPPTYAVETGSRTAEIYNAQGDKIKDWTKRGALETVLGDEKFMGFLAVAAGGAMAGYATGATGTAGITAGTGATPGTAGAIASSSGAGGFMGAGTVGAGAIPAGGSSLYSAGGDMGTGAYVPGGTGGPVPFGTTTSGTAAAGGTGFLSQMMGTANGNTDWAKLAAQGIGGLGNAYIANQQQQQMNRAVQEANAASIAAARESGGQVTDAAAIARDRMLQAGQQASQMAQFKPYNISGGLAGATFGPNGATQTLDPRMREIQDRNLALSSGFLNSVNAGTPDELARRSYEGYNSWAAPARMNEVAGLQNRLAGQGLIGMTANSVGTNGQQIAINPQMTELLEAQERARLKNYENSVLFGQQVTNNQLGMGNQQLGQAVGIDALGRENIKLGQSLGDSQATAGARAGGFLTGAAQQGGAWDVGAATQAGQWYNSAAQNAAQNLSGRRQSEAYADASRDANIWNSIWGSVIGA